MKNSYINLLSQTFWIYKRDVLTFVTVININIPTKKESNVLLETYLNLHLQIVT